MVLVIGFLLLVSVLLSSLLVTDVDALNRWMPGLPVLGQVLNLVISLAVITILLASIDKVLPDVRMPWRNLWLSTAAT
jgi:membrane protein